MAILKLARPTPPPTAAAQIKPIPAHEVVPGAPSSGLKTAALVVGAGLLALVVLK